MAENRVVGECHLCCTLGYRLNSFLYTTMRPSRLLLAESVYCCPDQDLFKSERPLRIKFSEGYRLAAHEYCL